MRRLASHWYHIYLGNLVQFLLPTYSHDILAQADHQHTEYIKSTYRLPGLDELGHLQHGLSSFFHPVRKRLAKKVELFPPHRRAKGEKPENILGNHVSLVNASLDLLSNTSTLYPETVLNAMRQSKLGPLCRLGQQLLDAVLARKLDQVGLPARRVHGVLPLASLFILVEAKRVRSLGLVYCRGCAGGHD